MEPEKALRATYLSGLWAASVGGGVYCSSECKVKGILLQHESLDELFEKSHVQRRVPAPQALRSGWLERVFRYAKVPRQERRLGGDDFRLEYVVILERGEKSFGAYVPDLPGCVAVGETKEEALHLIRETMESHLNGMRQEGLSIPEPSSSSELVKV